MSEHKIDYFRDPQSGGIVHDSNGPLWTVKVDPTLPKGTLKVVNPDGSTAAILTGLSSQEQHTDYRDLPAWCQPETIPQHSTHSRYAMLTGAIVLLCDKCHMPIRKDRNGRLVAVIEQRELTFVPERYCTCEKE